MLRIKDLRRSKNESQSHLARVVGVSLRTIQHWEAGTSDVPTKKLREIAKHYDVTVPYLFGGEETLKETLKEEIKEIKEFKDLSIEHKLNEIHNLLQIIHEAGNYTNEKIEENREMIARTKRSLFEQSMNFQEITSDLESKVKNLKNLS
tara:strand:+ start:1013 stop:1459 length:447 start_codon:yes stop_codon:yes gene_type:complete